MSESILKGVVKKRLRNIMDSEGFFQTDLLVKFMSKSRQVTGVYSRIPGQVSLSIPLDMINDEGSILSTLFHELGHAHHAIKHGIAGQNAPVMISLDQRDTEAEAWEYGLALARKYGIEPQYRAEILSVYSGVLEKVNKEIKRIDSNFYTLYWSIPNLLGMQRLLTNLRIEAPPPPPDIQESFSEVKRKMDYQEEQWRKGLGDITR